MARRKKIGRPAYKPDANTRRLVGALAFEGATQARIAAHIEVDTKTLRRHFRRELDLGCENLCALVAQNLARVALRPNGGSATVSAARYILGCRAGWKDTSRLEIDPHAGGLPGILDRVLADDRAEDREPLLPN